MLQAPRTLTKNHVLFRPGNIGSTDYNKMLASR